MDCFNLDSAVVSVIIPVYNVEQYVEKCVLSVRNQTYSNLEIIIVNDGSIDDSEMKILNCIVDDPRVKYYRKENGGLSSARNYGISRSKGEYICFIDSDDWVSENFIERLVYNLKMNNSDIAICNMEYIFENGKVKKRTPKVRTPQIIDNLTALQELFKGDQYKCHAQNKMYKRELFIKNEIEFPEGKLYEDVFTTYKLLSNANTVSLLNEDLYFYLQNRAGSILATKFNQKRFEVLEAIEDIAKFIKKSNSNCEKEFQKFYITNIISLVNYLAPIYFSLESNEKKIYKKLLLNNKMKSLRFKYWKNIHLNKIEKIRMFMINNCLSFYCFMMNKIQSRRYN